MTNAEVIQTMTVAELASMLENIQYEGHWRTHSWSIWKHWLRQDSQSKDGLLTDEMKKHWKVH